MQVRKSYKISINYNKRPKQTPWRGWNPFARSVLVYACECISQRLTSRGKYGGWFCQLADPFIVNIHDGLGKENIAEIS